MVLVTTNPGSGRALQLSPGRVREGLDDGPGRQLDAPEVEVDGLLARHPRHGGLTRMTLDRCATEVGTLRQQLPPVRVPEQRLDGRADLVPGRLHGGAGQEGQ